MKLLYYALFDDPQDQGIQIVHFLADEEETTEDMEWTAFDELGDQLGLPISRSKSEGWILSDICAVHINDTQVFFTPEELTEKKLW